MKHVVSILVLVLAVTSCQDDATKKKDQPQKTEVSNSSLQRVEPPNWWIGFKEQSLQLLVKDDGIGSFTPEINYQGVTIEKVHQAKSPNYLFIDLKIDETAQAGKFDILFRKEDVSKAHTYELKTRQKSSEDYIGFNSSDAIYLITPDRFANANPDNDSFDYLNEKGIDRSDDYKRHGGDLQGIRGHLDYIEDLGFTAVWPCPVLINDMPRSSYHGYAITDYYRVDPRFGTLDEYKDLSAQLKNRGMKLIMDQVANHCGLEHWWMKDLPFEDWVNYQKNFEDNMDNWNWENNINSNHRRTTNQDFYASKADKEGMAKGWFVSGMPDLNQRNPYMAKYLIQNSIWWIETLDLGGIRQDTYPYPDKDFMSNWAGAIMKEYPNFSIVGEEWSYNPLLVAYWQEGHPNKDGYDSNLKSSMDFPMQKASTIAFCMGKSSMDFPMQKAIVDALNEPESWDKGLVKLYEGLANDFAYSTPKDIMAFVDNHDMSRIHTQLDLDITNTKMALGYLLALPRIPQIYYGTEILMHDKEKPGDHGLIRSDFPGGWQSDTINAFTGDGLNADQKDMQGFLKRVLNYRKNSKAIHDGKTIHFAPENGVYVLFRMMDSETVVIILNKNEQAIELDLNRFDEMGLKSKTVKNIISDEIIKWDSVLNLSEKGVTILTTKH